MNLSDFLTSLLEGNRAKVDIFLGGLAGAVVRLAHEKNRSLKKALISLITGGLCAHYLTPLLLQWTKTSYGGTWGFFCGLIGMKVIDLIFDLISWIQNHPDKALKLLEKVPIFGGLFKRK